MITDVFTFCCCCAPTTLNTGHPAQPQDSPSSLTRSPTARKGQTAANEQQPGASTAAAVTITQQANPSSPSSPPSSATSTPSAPQSSDMTAGHVLTSSPALSAGATGLAAAVPHRTDPALPANPGPSGALRKPLVGPQKPSMSRPHTGTTASLQPQPHQQQQLPKSPLTFDDLVPLLTSQQRTSSSSNDALMELYESFTRHGERAPSRGSQLCMYCCHLHVHLTPLQAAPSCPTQCASPPHCTPPVPSARHCRASDASSHMTASGAQAELHGMLFTFTPHPHLCVHMPRRHSCAGSGSFRTLQRGSMNMSGALHRLTSGLGSGALLAHSPVLRHSPLGGALARLESLGSQGAGERHRDKL